MTQEQTEEFAKASQAFPELDDAARKRAEERTAAGAEAHAALAQESVMLNLVRAYNHPYQGRRG
ncbi:MAG TPA: hypothetical protein VF137_10185 [Candidatus Dormibacteraeota bacterium]